MKQKIMYTYNDDTGAYEPVRYTLWRRWLHVGLYVGGGILAGVFLYMVFLSVTEEDRERQLREHNEQLQSEIKALQRQTDEALAVMRDISDRDNNFYRVLMQADPVTDAQRYARLDRQRRISALDSLGDAALIATLRTSLDQLESQLYTQTKSLDYIRQQAINKKGRLDYLPAIPPVRFDDIENLSSGYGRRTDPIYGITKMHEGMDFSGEVGAPIYASAKGTVSFAGWKNGYGNLIIIDHGYDYETRYAHLSEIQVRVGEKVERGQQIGRLGNTGKSTGPHLHYEVRYKERPQNPINYYFYDLTPEQFDQLIRRAQNAGHVMD